MFDRWVDACPLDCISPNASSTRDVLGTLLLGILAGSRRYAHIAGVRGDAVWEYTVLVTNASYDITAIGQLYRDRCDCENGFDELKNQWGRGLHHAGHAPQPDHCARGGAGLQLVELVRARGQPQARSEALTSRPLLLAAVGRTASHGGQTTLYLTPMHAEAGLIKAMIANVQAAIRHVKEAAEQLPKLDRWQALLAYICQRIVGQTALPTPPPALAAPG